MKESVSTREILLWWRDKPTEEKKSIMKKRNIKSITYEQIKFIYLESL